MANLKSQGCSIWRLDSTQSPNVYEEIGQVVSVSGPDGEASEINVTNLGSSANEYIIGLPEEGNYTVEVIYDYATASLKHQQLIADRAAQTLQTFQFRFSDSPQSTETFSAYVKGFSKSVGVDDRVGATFTLRVSGAVTFA